MSITLSESALTTDQWNALGTLVEDAVFDLTLYAWNPLFDTAIAGSMARNDFDAAVYGNDVVRLSGSGISGLVTLLGSFVDPVGANYSSPPSLITDTDLYACVITATGISQAHYNGSWSAWTEIVTDSTVAYVAATAGNTVHYVTFDGTHYRFHVWASGAITDSGIYWGFPLTSFGAKRLNGKDVLAFIGNTPGTPSAKTENLKVVKYILPVGIVGVITYQYGSWSDHIEIDRVDQWSLFRYRSNLKLSLIDNTLWLTCYSSEGTAKQPITGTRVYSSRDGTHWSRGELLSVARSGKWGLSLQRLGTTLYAVGRVGGSSADSTLWFGQPHADTMLDISPYVHQLTVNRRDMQQISTVIDNEDDWISGSLLGQSRTFALLLSTGFWLGSSQILQPQGLFEVDSIEPAQEQPNRMAQITARDRFAWMATKTQSEQFVNWLPQGLGLDPYIDASGTGYGGMTHTAPADGTWQAHDNTLYLTTGNASGVAYSTYLFDTWNGSVQSHFGLASAANHEYAGLIFRSQDKDNGYVYYYDQTTDKLRLERWSGGTRTLIWQSSAKSWGSIASRYLRADFRYSQIRLFSSAASPGVNAHITWTLENSLVVDGFTDSATADSGYVGSLGKGFSDLDTWNLPPPPIGPGDFPPWLDPYLPGVPLPFPAYTVDTLPTKLIILDSGSAACHIATTLHIEAMVPVPDYVSASSGLTGANIDLTADPWNYDRYFALQSTGLFRNDSPFTGGSWSLVADYATMFGSASASPYQIEMSINRSGYIAIRTGYNGFAYSFNLGATWQHSSINGATYNSTFSGLAGFLLGIAGHFAVSPYNNGAQGWVYAAVPSLEGATNGGYYKSTDWGATWTLKLGIANSIVEGGANLSVPYMKPGGTAANINDSSQLVYAASGADNNEDAFIISPDGGTTWNYVIHGAHLVGVNIPFSTGGGTALVPFTWDGGVILAASARSFMHIYDYDALVAGAWDNTSGYCPGVSYVGFPASTTARLNGFSNHRWARLLYYASSTTFYWGFTPDATMTAVSAPVGYTGIGSLEWKIDL